MGKFIDLTGQQFGKWTVLCRGKDHISKSGKSYVMWRCQCACDTVKEVSSRSLRRGRSKSCGCIEYDSKSLKDLIGLRFGRLVVIRETEQHSKSKSWDCLCDCGSIISIQTNSLTSGHTKSCGCLVSLVENRDLTDRKIGRLTVIREIERKICGGKGRRYYLCQCSCGNTTEVTRDALLQGNTQSCGCLYQEVNRQRGANSHAWKDGLTPLQTLIRHSERYVEWRDSVLRRDKYVCALSGVKNCRDLEVHHIKSFVQILRENNITTLEEAFACQELWDVSNGVTLSEEYHSGIVTNNPNAFHRLYGTKKCTPQDFREWFLAITPEFAEELRCG